MLQSGPSIAEFLDLNWFVQRLQSQYENTVPSYQIETDVGSPIVGCTMRQGIEPFSGLKAQDQSLYRRSGIKVIDPAKY